MNKLITIEQKQKLLRRAVDGLSSANGDAYIDALEDALVKALVQRTSQRKELQRLNQQVRFINSLVAHNDKLQDDVETLIAVLDREDSEQSDTDPTQLTVVEDNFPTNQVNAISVNQSGGINVGAPTPVTESYDAWDMRTRYAT